MVYFAKHYKYNHIGAEPEERLWGLKPFYFERAMFLLLNCQAVITALATKFT